MSTNLTTAPMPTDLDVLNELEPVAEQLLERHLRLAEEWFPHEYVPWSQGRDFDAEPWTPDQPRLDGVARTALYVNLLTEDNLPSYHRILYRHFGRPDSPWMNWVHRWTAEEGRHSIVLRDYLVVTRNEDPVALERGRMQVTQTGYEAGDKDALHVMAYVAFQELATRLAHRNTGRFSGDPVADRLMARVAADENLHMVFYRDLMRAALETYPSAAVRAIVDEVTGFDMPGAIMDDFARMAIQIANAGIYDLRGHHDEVIWPLLRAWGLFDVEGLDADAERQREQLSEFLDLLEAKATRHEEKRAARAEATPVG